MRRVAPGAYGGTYYSQDHMSNPKTAATIGEYEYDLDRCTKQQLIEYVIDLITHDPKERVQRTGTSNHVSGNVVLDRYSDEPAAEISTHLASQIRLLTERYRKAVG